MERRTDYRHGLQYELTLTDPHRRTVPQPVVTADVSASGLRFTTVEPHGLVIGTRVEVRMLAPVSGKPADDPMML